MRMAFVGCGFVADLYARTLGLHDSLELAGVYDRDAQRAQRFAAHWSTSRYESLDHLLADPRIELVVNLTSPSAHYEVSRRSLEAGKHVYTEKPISLDPGRMHELVAQAEALGLQLAAAPCSLLGEAAQTAWHALRRGRIGPVRLVYAEMDDGPVHQMAYRSWLSASGTAWPYRSEFETGCTLEHAGYQVSWLAAFFGPAVGVTAVSTVQIPDKGVEPPLERDAPDFSLACIRFASGVVARLTCSIVASRDHSLRIIGDDGILTVADTWLYRSPVYLQRWHRLRRRLFLSPWRHRLPLLGRGNPRIGRRGAAQIDFLRGVRELADALREERPSRLSARFSLHVNEIVLAIHEATEKGATREISSSFDPIEPMEWARG